MQQTARRWSLDSTTYYNQGHIYKKYPHVCRTLFERRNAIINLEFQDDVILSVIEQEYNTQNRHSTSYSKPDSTSSDNSNTENILSATAASQNTIVKHPKKDRRKSEQLYTCTRINRQFNQEFDQWESDPKNMKKLIKLSETMKKRIQNINSLIYYYDNMEHKVTDQANFRSLGNKHKTRNGNELMSHENSNNNNNNSTPARAALNLLPRLCGINQCINRDDISKSSVEEEIFPFNQTDDKVESLETTQKRLKEFRNSITSNHGQHNYPLAKNKDPDFLDIDDINDLKIVDNCRYCNDYKMNPRRKSSHDLTVDFTTIQQLYANDPENFTANLLVESGFIWFVFV